MFPFEQLIELPHAIARHRNGPMVEDRSRYLAYLASEGMSCGTLRLVAPYLLVIADRLRLARRPGEIISPDEITREAARWARRKPRLFDRMIGDNHPSTSTTISFPNRLLGGKPSDAGPLCGCGALRSGAERSAAE